MEYNTDNSTFAQLSGAVIGIVFHNPESGYTIAKIADEQGNDRTVTGIFPMVNIGQEVELEGVWAQHREYGKQFKVEKFRFVIPTEKSGLIKFLASGIIPGVGPKMALSIVNYFGDKTIQILDEKPERLREIEKIGAKKAAQIKEGWQKVFGNRELYIYLQSLGLTPQFCKKLIDRYGANAAQIVKANPYRLAGDIGGVGFLKADKIAVELGIAPDAPTRLLAGIVYNLNELTAQGHTCFPKNELISIACQMLKIKEDLLYPALELALKSRQIMTDGELVYPARLFKAEHELPRHLKRICTVKNYAAKAIAEVPPGGNLTLNEQQLNAIMQVAKTPISIITGGPGVGKTTVLGELVRRAKRAKLQILLAAPTGRAAKRMSDAAGLTAKTIHRLLMFDPATGEFQHDAVNPLEADLIIVDEVSMLDLPLALALFQSVKAGTAVVLVGDADQLPSVGPGTVLADLIACGKFALTHLTQVFRQSAESFIIQNAHLVNAGKLPTLQPLPEQLGDYYWIKCDAPEHARNIIEKMVTERIPERFKLNPATDIQLLTPMNRGTCGTGALNELLQSLLNGGDEADNFIGKSKFKLHDRVMQTANNYDKGVFNGDLGRIIKVDERKKVFSVAFDGLTTASIEYNFDESDELSLAYAVTIHKSQGCEFTAVIVTLFTQHFMMLQRNLLYTAMTRARKLLVLVGDEKAVSMAVNNVSMAPRYGNLKPIIKQVWEDDK